MYDVSKKIRYQIVNAPILDIQILVSKRKRKATQNDLLQFQRKLDNCFKV